MYNQVPFWLQHDKFNMFAKPREKKGLLIPPSKKRKTTHAVEEINFDNDARSEYLTGFRKRKQARIKHAQGIAAEKARQEKIELRRQVGNGLVPAVLYSRSLANRPPLDEERAKASHGRACGGREQDTEGRSRSWDRGCGCR